MSGKLIKITHLMTHEVKFFCSEVGVISFLMGEEGREWRRV